MNPTPSFSVIVCSIDAGKFAQISAAYRRLLAGHRCEIIGIHDAASLAAGYNRGIQQASGDILIFSHDDILILDPDFAAKVVHRLTHFDLLGFAGASKLVSDLWAGADLPFLHGVIAHAPAQSRQITLDVFG
ncbi:MAG TPA: glycosyltransferase, partial [Azonexus sp.]|nr:glycosyltransferase [Azonexus sp.]